MTITLTDGDQIQYTQDEAEAALHQYLLGAWETEGAFNKAVPDQWRSGRVAPGSATRLYDPYTAEDGLLSPLQIIAANGLNARISTAERSVLTSLLPDVNELLKALPRFSLWDLDESEWQNDGLIDQMDAIGAFLCRAKGVSYTKAHKLLHLARPLQFPLVDRKTSAYLPQGQWWRTIATDVRDHTDAFERLVELAATYAAQDPLLVPIERLRIHDILVWLHATDRR